MSFARSPSSGRSEALADPGKQQQTHVSVFKDTISFDDDTLDIYIQHHTTMIQELVQNLMRVFPYVLKGISCVICWLEAQKPSNIYQYEG